MRYVSVKNYDSLSLQDSFAAQIKEYVSGAVVFYADAKGKQTTFYTAEKAQRQYPSLMKYVCAEERRRLALLLYKGLSGLLRADGGSLDYLLVMQGDGGRKNCALLSLDETGCNTLSRYKSKLEGGERLLFGTVKQNPNFSVSRHYREQLKKRLSAVNCIGELSKVESNEKSRDYPLNIGKLALMIKAFSVSKAAGHTSVNLHTERAEEIYCTLTAKGVKTLMLLTAFLIRNSVGAVNISAEKRDGKSVSMIFSADVDKSLFFDMYLKTSRTLLKAGGIDCSVRMRGSKLIITAALPYTEPASHMLSDIQEYYALVESEINTEAFGNAFELFCGA